MVTTAERGRVGRPRTRDKAEPRQYVGFPVPVALKQQLEAAAAENGHSLSAEGVDRLLASFADAKTEAKTAREVVDATLGGRELRVLTYDVNFHFREGGEAEAIYRNISRDPQVWMADPDCYKRAMVRAIVALANRFPGTITPDDLKIINTSVYERLASQAQRLSGFIDPNKLENWPKPYDEK
jgi:hypothetical protein